MLSPEAVITHELAVLLYSYFIIPVIVFSLIFYILAFTGIRRKSKKKVAKKTGNDKWPSVTIQIPTLNEPVALRCAKKCLNFDYPKNKFQIIIGDDSDNPEISRVIDDFARKHPQVMVTRRKTNEGYKPGNLNHMLKYSTGDIIVIFDSDFAPRKNFLRGIVKPFIEDEKVACVQAKWDYMNIRKNKISKFAGAILMVYHHLIAPINNRFGVSLLFGSGEAVRRKVLLELGGWKNWSMTEDVEFSLRVLKGGYKTVYLSDLTVSGEVPYTLKGLSKQQKRWAYGNARAFFDNIKWILFGRRFSLAQKFLLFITLLGYISAPILVSFTALGFITWFTGTPGAIDFVKFFSETSKIVLINSGFLAASIVALKKEKKLRMALSVLVASLTYGILVSISVFDGLIKAVFRKQMKWYMIKKRGNELIGNKVNIPLDASLN